jgi:2,3-bisphosphoglycerate-dependent phosphoglycerate mutase
VPTQIVFETHSMSEDNERGIATGWLPGRLSPLGREQAAELGRRRHADGIAAVFCSDLARAAETASIAFAGSGIPILADWRLRECDYGELNDSPAGHVATRSGFDHALAGVPLEALAAAEFDWQPGLEYTTPK